MSAILVPFYAITWYVYQSIHINFKSSENFIKGSSCESIQCTGNLLKEGNLLTKRTKKNKLKAIHNILQNGDSVDKLIFCSLHATNIASKWTKTKMVSVCFNLVNDLNHTSHFCDVSQES